MTRLIETFKNVDFETKYNNNCGLISGCHEQKRLDKDKSSFWLLHQKKGYDMPKINPFDWKSSNLVTSVEKIVLEGVLQLLKNAIEDAVDQKDILTTMIPGFVTTGKAVHQGYHLDNTEINFDTENEAFIVHIPLCVEGMWLRLAKLEKNKLNETMYHIPFGRGIILPSYQLHSGHYGQEGNLRFHAVLSTCGWQGRGLLNLDDYLKKKKVPKKNQSKIKRCAIESSKKSVEECIQKPSSSIAKSVTTYKKDLIKMNPTDTFMKAMFRYNRDKDYDMN